MKSRSLFGGSEEGSWLEDTGKAASLRARCLGIVWFIAQIGNLSPKEELLVGPSCCPDPKVCILDLSFLEMGMFLTWTLS